MDGGAVVAVTKNSSLLLRTLFTQMVVVVMLMHVVWMGVNSRFVGEEHPPTRLTGWANQTSRSSSTNSKGFWTRSEVEVFRE